MFVTPEIELVPVIALKLFPESFEIKGKVAVLFPYNCICPDAEHATVSISFATSVTGMDHDENDPLVIPISV